MRDLYIFPYRNQSRSVRELSQALNINRIRRENSTFVGKKSKTVINWGAIEVPEEVTKCQILNQPGNVHQNSNKLEFFNNMSTDGGPRVPPFTTKLDKVMSWLKDGKVVVARQELASHSGKGIVFLDNVEAFVKAPLYTQYVKKRSEFRLHFGPNGIFDVQKKVLRSQDDEGNDINPKTVDWRIRNHSNGFMFIREFKTLPADVKRQAEKAARLSGLDFGAVDVLYNEHEDQAYVLEINTAPGLEGETIGSYVKLFREWV